MSSNNQPGTTVHVTESRARAISGFVPALIALVAILGSIGWLIYRGVTAPEGPAPAELPLAVLLILLGVTIATGLDIVQPGATKVVQFFGRYVGTVRRTGLVLTVPFTARSTVSIRVSNFETSELKVNDADGNPVNIASIIVWQVSDTAKAMFAVEDYSDFVHVQAESALRHVAMGHPYDTTKDGVTSLRGSTDNIADEIAREVSARVAIAGIDIIEARISKLAYAPEIAQAMLQRQQAGAIIAARELIVEGAVTMVQSALERLEAEQIVSLDDERKAAMVSNLLVVLCGDSRATPVVNTGTLYT